MPDQARFGTLGDPTLVVGSLHVYRQFRLDLSGPQPRLLSRVYDSEWSPGAMTAECAPPTSLSLPLPTPVYRAWRPSHPAPAEGCSCGFYGWYTPDEDWIDDVYTPVGPVVFGAVTVTGRAVLGDSGLRAERARLLALAAPHRRYAAELLAAAPEVPVYPDRAALLAALPPGDWSGLLGERETAKEDARRRAEEDPRQAGILDRCPCGCGAPATSVGPGRLSTAVSYPRGPWASGGVIPGAVIDADRAYRGGGLRNLLRRFTR